MKQKVKYDPSKVLVEQKCVVCDTVVSYRYAEKPEKNEDIVVCNRYRSSCVKKFEGMVLPKIEVVNVDVFDGKKATEKSKEKKDNG